MLPELPLWESRLRPRPNTCISRIAHRKIQIQMIADSQIKTASMFQVALLPEN